jgi:hypothetical protein
MRTSFWVFVSEEKIRVGRNRTMKEYRSTPDNRRRVLRKAGKKCSNWETCQGKFSGYG